MATCAAIVAVGHATSFGCGLDDRDPLVLSDPPALQPGGGSGARSGADATGSGDAAPIGGEAVDDAAPVAAAALTGVAPSVDTLDHGRVTIGRASPLVLSLSNAGSASLPSLTARVSGPDASDFVVADNRCDAGLESGGRCSVIVEFSPAREGEHAARLQLDAAAAGALSVPLVGRGVVAGALRASLGGHDFGLVALGSGAAAWRWSVENASDGVLPAPELSASGSEAFSSTHDCPDALPPGGSCDVTSVFQPRDVGWSAAHLVASSGSASIELGLVGAGAYRLTVGAVGGGPGRIEASRTELTCDPTCSALVDDGALSLVATTDNGSDSLFAGWSEPCLSRPAAPGNDVCVLSLDDHATVEATFLRAINNMVFVSSESYPASRGSVASYDAECNALASQAGINNETGSGFIAALSSDTLGLRERLGGAVQGWVRRDGLPFGETIETIFDEGVVQLAVGLDEWGHRIDGASVWSGTTTNGLPSTGTCDGWSSATGSVTLGGTSLGPRWIDNGIGGCGGARRVFCMGRTKTDPLAVPEPEAGKQLWVSREPYRVGSGTPDEHCDADRPATATAALALVARTDRAAAERVDPDAVYVRPDGRRVALGGDLLAGRLVAGPWLFSDSTVTAEALSLWTGSDGLGELARSDQNCADFTSTSGTVALGSYGDSDASFWSSGANADCGGEGRLYCIEP